MVIVLGYFWKWNLKNIWKMCFQDLFGCWYGVKISLFILFQEMELVVKWQCYRVVILFFCGKIDG